MKNIKEPVQIRRLTKNNALTIPKQIIKKLKLSGGDYVAIQIVNGVICLTKNPPTKKLTGLYSKKRREIEADADEDWKKGRYKDFDNMEDLINDLHN
jgi:antitoxin component of MazEF toxin-antitoxin module